MLLVNNITKIYNERNSSLEVVALNNVTLTLPDKGLVAIVGTSGCGKTTLLNILSGIDQPSDGRVFCDGEEVDFTSSMSLDIYRSYSTSLVFQEYNLLHDYNVIDNVKLGLRLQGKPRRQITQKAKAALDAVGLSALAKRKIKTLSGGQQQRVAVARAIAKDSKIVFCDEPTGNLDSLNANEVFSFIKQCSNNRLFVVVTHDEVMAKAYADRIIRLSDGVVVEDTIDDLAFRRANVPNADELFAVDNRKNNAERVANYLKDKVAKSSDKFKKSADNAFGSIHGRNANEQFKNSLEKVKRDFKRTTSALSQASSQSFRLLHDKTSRKVWIKDSLEKFGIRDNANNNDKDKRVHGLSFGNVLLMIKNNIFRSAIFNSAIIIALVIALSLVSVFFSLQLYKGQSSLEQTLLENNYYVLPVVKYKDLPVKKVDSTTGATIIEHGAKLYYNECSESDLDSIRALAGQDVKVYPSYFWNKNLQDFTDKFVFSESNNMSFAPYTFREIVVVDDFSMLSSLLEWGKLPSKTGEVLIYDYMAYALIKHGIVAQNIDSVDKVVGIELTDVNTGITIKISGILKSNYQAYSYIDNAQSVDLEEGYLTSLQNVFCTSATRDSILTDVNYTSVNQCKITFAKDEQGISNVIDANVKKLKSIDISNKTILFKNDQLTNGIYLSLNMASKLLGISPVDFNEQYAQKLFASTVNVNLVSPTYLPQVGATSKLNYQIVGICADNIDSEGVFAYYVEGEDNLGVSNGTFKNFYLNLSRDWSINANVIDRLWMQDKSDEFYRDNPDYSVEGYAEASAFGESIRQSDYYLVKVRALARDVMLIILAVVTVLIIIYTSYTLKKYNYKIAVLKALGANTSHILAIFGTQLLLIGILSYIVSVPVSFVVMDLINAQFIGDISAVIVYFVINYSALLLALAFAVVGVMLAASIPLLRTSLASPMKIIRANKKSR